MFGLKAQSNFQLFQSYYVKGCLHKHNNGSEPRQRRQQRGRCPLVSPACMCLQRAALLVRKTGILGGKQVCAGTAPHTAHPSERPTEISPQMGDHQLCEVEQGPVPGSALGRGHPGFSAPGFSDRMEDEDGEQRRGKGPGGPGPWGVGLEPAVSWQPRGTSLSWGSRIASRARVRLSLCSALGQPHLQFWALQYKKETELLESAQRRLWRW